MLRATTTRSAQDKKGLDYYNKKGMFMKKNGLNYYKTDQGPQWNKNTDAMDQGIEHKPCRQFIERWMGVVPGVLAYSY